MELDYKTFKEDCKAIIEPVIKKYGYLIDESKSEDYINYYFSENGYIEVSMLRNFPHIGVTIDYLTKNYKYIRRSVLDDFLTNNQREIIKFYSDFKSQFTTNNYVTEMRCVVAVMEQFYKPILVGEINLNDLLNNENV